MNKAMNWFRHNRMVARNIYHRYGPARKFRKFEASVHPETWARHDELLKWAESKLAEREVHEAGQLYEMSSDPIVRQGYELIKRVKEDFEGRYRDYRQLRVLVHLPPFKIAPAHASLCANFIQGFHFLGIVVKGLEWSDDTREVLESFQPTLLMTVDNSGHLNQIDWDAVREYRRKHHLCVALQTSLQENVNTPIAERIEWAARHEIDFYYSYTTSQYIAERCPAILERGYRLFSLEFGNNPLVYYPVSSLQRDLNYIFLGSTNPDKWPRYYSYLGPLLHKHPGYIDGPWWHMLSRFGNAETHRYLCARAKVGLNLHIKNQIEWAGELNERTYNLAACGVPQLIDAPKLLCNRFQPDSFFVARTPKEYQSLFEEILQNPEEAQRRALQAQREVFERHTIFHRVDSFVVELFQSGIVEMKGPLQAIV
jgi:hypothetical protein